MKKGIKLFLCVCIIISCLAACQQKEKLASVDQSTESPPVVAVAAGDIEGGSDFVLGGEPEDLELPAYFAGTVSFDVASENYAELPVDAMAINEQQISITTSEGIVWTLIIPAGAVNKNVVVTMTELKNIVSSDIGSMATGVLLEPDGLKFNLPVTLRMTGESLGSIPFLLSGSHDGSTLSLAQIELVDGGVSASITHFSTMYGNQYDEEKIKILSRIAGEKYKAIKIIALKFLKTKITAPEPVAIPIRCAGDETKVKQQDAALELFIRQFESPEIELARMLLESGRTDVLLGAENDSIELAKKVMERLVIKANNLYKQYYPQEEYLLAIARVGITYERQYYLLGGKSEGDTFITKIGKWERLIAEKYLEDIRKKHDYQVIPYLMMLDREATITGFSKDDSINEIDKATRFKIQWDFEAKTDLDSAGIMTTTTHGEAKYHLYYKPGTDPFSTGQGQYTGLDWPSQEGEELVMTSPSEFDFRASIENFDPCETGTMDIVISRFGSDNEDFELRTPEGVFVGPYLPYLLIVQNIAWESFKDWVIDTPGGEQGYPWFRFTVPIQNLNPTAGELELTQEIPFNTGNLKIIVSHIPE